MFFFAIRYVDKRQWEFVDRALKINHTWRWPKNTPIDERMIQTQRWTELATTIDKFIAFARRKTRQWWLVSRIPYTYTQYTHYTWDLIGKLYSRRGASDMRYAEVASKFLTAGLKCPGTNDKWIYLWFSRVANPRHGPIATRREAEDRIYEKRNILHARVCVSIQVSDIHSYTYIHYTQTHTPPIRVCTPCAWVRSCGSSVWFLVDSEAVRIRKGRSLRRPRLIRIFLYATQTHTHTLA